MAKGVIALVFACAVACAAEQRRLTLAAPSRARGASRLALLRGGGQPGKVPAVDRQKCAARHSALYRACEKLAGDHMRGIIFGGLDGTLTTFAIMAASIGAQQKPQTTLVLGLSTLLADAFGMAGGEYLSSKAEREVLTPRALKLAELEPSPLAKGFAMFSAFLFFGAIPLIGFVASHMAAVHLPKLEHGAVSAVVTTAALFALGAVKSQFGKGPWWRSGGEVVLVGGVAAGVAYSSALLADRLVSSM
ncbi:hypothetical protein KFE25_007741 [Diacronema lutheri]|uniref:Uncharacterized protein n=1 Tax=Diacronema lutheri TaxID=2081491 RepID=A0A8J6CIU4_DIALT|nr:hypothetical protein KFE25_007741 [Diacronema lutheri]